MFSRDEARRLLRFALVGVSNGVVTFALYALLVKVGTAYLIAASVGYLAGILNGYTWNRTWTFETGPFELPEFSRYAIVQGFGFCANLAGLIIVVELTGAGKILAEVIALIPVVLSTFLLNRWWTFRGATPLRNSPDAHQDATK